MVLWNLIFFKNGLKANIFNNVVCLLKLFVAFVFQHFGLANGELYICVKQIVLFPHPRKSDIVNNKIGWNKFVN